MATVKLKFRESSVKNREGTLYIQILHKRKIRQISTTFKIYREEWDDISSEIVIPIVRGQRATYLQLLRSRIKFDLNKLDRIICSFELNGSNFTSEDVVSAFHSLSQAYTLVEFVSKVVSRLNELGRVRTAETYIATLRSFMGFRNGEDVALELIDSDLMQSYESYLKGRGITPNTISFYMRILRAIYNRAVERDLVEQCHPFKHVYTGVDKTLKRAIHLKYIKRLKELDLITTPRQEVVRDMFLFSFYTRGMSFIDMAYLRKKDLVNGILSYRRRKTNQPIHIKWERCMQEIVDRHATCDGSPYLLPIIKRCSDISERNQYRNALINYNKRLKLLGEVVGVRVPLTMYVARHSWASVAKSKNIPISVISEGMGHDSEATTQIYLASLDSSLIDKANNLILKLL